MCVWGLGVEKCSVMFRFHLDSAALYIHSVGMKGERKAGFECSGGGDVFRSGPQASLYETGFPRARSVLKES